MGYEYVSEVILFMEGEIMARPARGRPHDCPASRDQSGRAGIEA
jgi:hypothetical protein